MRAINAISILLVSILAISLASANSAGVGMNGQPGTIWTTNEDCGKINQDVNHYLPGEVVYINGKNFMGGAYNWTITGNPGKSSCDPDKIIATGIKRVDNTGNFCLEAYIVNQDDCGEYKVNFGTKNDNYRIDNIPVVPEFGLIAGMITVMGALGTFFVIRRN